MQRTVVLYHASCADGMASAWAAHRNLGADAEYIPSYYDGARDPEAYRDAVVYMVDFSWPRADLLKLADNAFAVKVIDHHRTAQQELDGLETENLRVHFDMAHSGAWLSWCYFNPHEAAPSLIRYVEDRDLWLWQLPDSREVSAWLRTYDFSIEAYQDAYLTLETSRDIAITVGRRVLNQQRLATARIADTCHFQTFGVGHDRREVILAPTVNCPQATGLQSEVCEELLRRYPDAPMAAAWSETSNDKRQWSLRSRPTPDGACFDVSTIAKLHGGGGHKCAAGFTEHTKD